MKYVTIESVLSKKITGEWGKDPIDSTGTKVIRTTNFTNLGIIDYSKIVSRKIEQKKIEQKKLYSGDVIIEKSGGSPTQPVGRVVFFVNPDDSIYLCNNFTSILRPNLDLVSPKYFFYTLFYNHLSKKTLRYQNKTTGIINLQLERYLKSKIPLPLLDDQIRIAAVLTRAENLIAKRKESIELLDELLKSTFLEMFGDIKAKKSSYKWEKPRPYLKAKSGKSSKTVLSVTKTNFPIYGGNGINGWATKALYTKPIIIAGRVGQQCGIIHLSKGPCWVTDNAIVIQIMNKNKLKPTYLSYAFRHSPIIEKVKQLDLPFINQSMLLDILIPIPPPDLQNKFAKIVEKVKSIKSKYKQSLTELENLYGALSQRAFKGELDLSKIPIKKDIELKANISAVTITSKVEVKVQKPFSKQELLSIIKNRNGNPFNFNELWDDLEKADFKEMPAYDEIKDMVFMMLEDKEPILSQSFDEDKKEIVLKGI